MHYKIYVDVKKERVKLRSLMENSGRSGESGKTLDFEIGTFFTST